MCITFFMIPNEEQLNKNWPFLMFFNREENLFRMTLPVSRHESSQFILCATDMWRKGTWLAVNHKTKNFAFLTNLIEELDKPFKLSTILIQEKKPRGRIIYDYIQMEEFNEELQDEYIRKIIDIGDQYNGSNLFLGNWKHLKRIFFLDIYHKRVVNLKPGYLYGLSNNLFLYTCSMRVKKGLDMFEVVL